MALQLKRGTKAKIDALALRGGLLEGEPLYFTDLQTVGIATSKGSYETLGKGHWAAKLGPTSFSSANRHIWQQGRGFGNSLDWMTYDYGIQVLVTGQYEARAVQRKATTDTSSPYIALSLSGDRSTLENRTTGIFTHDHATGVNGFTESVYVGLLNAGEIVSAGAPNSAVAPSLVFGVSSFVGSIIIKRLI